MSISDKKYLPIPVITTLAEDAIDIGIKSYALPAIKKAVLKRNLKTSKETDFYHNSVFARDDADKTSLLGTLVFDTIKLTYLNANYIAANANVLGSNLDLSVEFDIVQAIITQDRNIITTAVNGLNGTIKEFIADGDYQIECKATIAMNGMDYYDYDFMNNVATLFQVQDVIQIESSIICRVFNIDTVVVTGYKFYQPESGMRNVQEITFTLISDNVANYNLIFQ